MTTRRFRRSSLTPATTPILVCLALAAGVSLVAPLPAAPAGQPKELPDGSIPIVVSKETTVFVEPLNPDGTVNYVEALNRVQSEGVTREKNFGVVLVEVMGPGLFPEALRPQLGPQLAKALGVEIIAGPECFITLDDFARAKVIGPGVAADQAKKVLEQVWDELCEASDKPWAPQAWPVVSGWLDANVKPLDRLVAGAARKHCYLPLLCERQPAVIYEAQALALGPSRWVARALAARAMRSAGTGDMAAARRDLVALLRLSRHTAQSAPMQIAQLVGVANRAMLADCLAALAAQGKLSADDAKALIAELRAVEPLPTVLEVIEGGDRYFGLDVVTALQRNPTTAFLQEMATPEGAPPPRPWGNHRIVADFGRVLKNVDAAYDRAAVALAATPYTARRKAIANVQSWLKSDCDRLSRRR